MSNHTRRNEQIREVDRLRSTGMTVKEACSKVGINASAYYRWRNPSPSKVKQDEPADRMIFISHRHQDKKLADALRRQLLNWDFSEEQIFQSSHPKAGPTIGSNIKREIARALGRAQLVILIYTYDQYDWQYCMWEVGLAMDPLSMSKRTRVMALQCFDDIPKVFIDELIVSINYNDIQRYVRQFHKEDQFFPGFPPYKPRLAGQASKDRSKALFEALREASKELILAERETTPLWGCITLGLDPATTKELADAEEEDRTQIHDKIVNKLKVISADNKGLEPFGFADPERELRRRPNLKRLVNRWRRKVSREPTSADWVTDLCDEIFEAIQNEPITPTWLPFRSASEKAYVFPLVNTVRTLPDESMEFDVFVYRMPAPSN